MKWRDWAVEKFGYASWKIALGKIHGDIYFGESNQQFFDYIEWLELKIEPEHYIKAACLCVLEAKP
jgi:hypothetical protein